MRRRPRWPGFPAVTITLPRPTAAAIARLPPPVRHPERTSTRARSTRADGLVEELVRPDRRGRLQRRPAPRPEAAQPSAARICVERLRVLGRGHVARVLAHRDRAHGAAQDLGRARLRQRLHEHHARRLERPAQLASRPARAAPRAVVVAVRRPARRSTRSPRPWSRRARRRRPTPATAGCDTSTDSTSAGPSRLPATLIVSSERPEQEPVAVLVDQRPVAVAPDVRVHRPVGLHVALGVAPDAARHPRPGLLADQLADLAAHRVARRGRRRRRPCRARRRRASRP